MIDLDYRLTAEAIEEARRTDLPSADEVTLRYHLFQGDVFLLGDGVDLSAPWGYVPVLDFAIGLEYAMRLGRRQKNTFDFQDTDAVIRLQREDEDVRISCSYAPGVIRTDFSALVTSINRFVDRVVVELCREFPTLADNAAVRPYLARQRLART